MLKIWGRANSVNVQKVLWTCDEIALPYERIDAGMKFGINTTPPFLANNPNGKIPLIEDGDFLLWESNAIMRYLALAHGGSAIYPADPKVRGGVERWLDWTISTLQPAERPVFWGYVRTAPAQRDNTELRLAAEKLGEVYGILDHHLAGRTFVEGEAFSLADRCEPLLQRGNRRPPAQSVPPLDCHGVSSPCNGGKPQASGDAGLQHLGVVGRTDLRLRPAINQVQMRRIGVACLCPGRRQKLRAGQGCEQPIPRHQLIEAAGLRYHAVLEEQDAVGVPDCRQTERDHEGRAPPPDGRRPPPRPAWRPACRRAGSRRWCGSAASCPAAPCRCGRAATPMSRRSLR